jgi:predicted nucleic acid-binding protein
LQQMLHDGNATANLVSDSHLAALAVEHNCQLCSSDADFARFPKLNWHNPIRFSSRSARHRNTS